MEDDDEESEEFTGYDNSNIQQNLQNLENRDYSDFIEEEEQSPILHESDSPGVEYPEEQSEDEYPVAESEQVRQKYFERNDDQESDEIEILTSSDDDIEMSYDNRDTTDQFESNALNHFEGEEEVEEKSDPEYSHSEGEQEELGNEYANDELNDEETKSLLRQENLFIDPIFENIHQQSQNLVDFDPNGGHQEAREDQDENGIVTFNNDDIMEVDIPSITARVQPESFPVNASVDIPSTAVQFGVTESSLQDSSNVITEPKSSSEPVADNTSTINSFDTIQLPFSQGSSVLFSFGQTYIDTPSPEAEIDDKQDSELQEKPSESSNDSQTIEDQRQESLSTIGENVSEPEVKETEENTNIPPVFLSNPVGYSFGTTLYTTTDVPEASSGSSLFGGFASHIIKDLGLKIDDNSTDQESKDLSDNGVKESERKLSMVRAQEDTKTQKEQESVITSSNEDIIESTDSIHPEVEEDQDSLEIISSKGSKSDADITSQDPLLENTSVTEADTTSQESTQETTQQTIFHNDENHEREDDSHERVELNSDEDLMEIDADETAQLESFTKVDGVLQKLDQQPSDSDADAEDIKMIDNDSDADSDIEMEDDYDSESFNQESTVQSQQQVGRPFDLENVDATLDKEKDTREIIELSDSDMEEEDFQSGGKKDELNDSLHVPTSGSAKVDTSVVVGMIDDLDQDEGYRKSENSGQSHVPSSSSILAKSIPQKSEQDLQSIEDQVITSRSEFEESLSQIAQNAFDILAGDLEIEEDEINQLHSDNRSVDIDNMSRIDPELLTSQIADAIERDEEVSNFEYDTAQIATAKLVEQVVDDSNVQHATGTATVAVNKQRNEVNIEDEPKEQTLFNNVELPHSSDEEDDEKSSTDMSNINRSQEIEKGKR